MLVLAVHFCVGFSDQYERLKVVSSALYCWLGPKCTLGMAPSAIVRPITTKNKDYSCWLVLSVRGRNDLLELFLAQRSCSWQFHSFVGFALRFGDLAL